MKRITSIAVVTGDSLYTCADLAVLCAKAGGTVHRHLDERDEPFGALHALRSSVLASPGVVARR